MALSRICRDLDGLPLAIELTAAQVRMLSPEQIAAGLRDRFGCSRAALDALAQQLTLCASVDWSYELLSESDRLLFRRLCVAWPQRARDTPRQDCCPIG